MNIEEVVLEKGQYLEPEYKTFHLESLLVGITEYKQPIVSALWHSHKNPLISFVLKGANLEYRRGRKLVRIPGNTTFYHAYESHQNIYSHFPSKHISLEIEESFLTQYNLTETAINIALQKSHIAKFLMSKILKEVLTSDNLSSLSVEMLFLDLIAQSHKIKDKNSFPPWVFSLYEILNDRWNEPLTLQELSFLTQVHPITISKHFRKYFAFTFGEYMRKIKVEKAMALLKASNQPLTEIAYLCGFADQSHFTRTFKHHTGFLPKQYQKL